MERFFVAAGPWGPDDAALAAAARKGGARCMTAATARDATQALKEAPPAALLLDAQLEGAADFAAAVRQNHELDLLPLLVAIAAPTDADAVRAYTMGGDDFVLFAELATQLPQKLEAA